MVPIYKGGEAELCDNYRPIALLNTISKILEKIVAIHLTNHLEFHKLLSKNQFGFQMGKSTQHNLLLVTDYISKAMNDGEFCTGVFLDLKKAFDVCSHSIILRKLQNFGIKNNKLKWFEAIFLTDPSELKLKVNYPPHSISIFQFFKVAFLAQYYS